MLKSKFSEYIYECGCDRAGRGCLAGPVVAAAVILPDDFECELLNDSKQLSEKQRYILRGIIEEKALSFAVAEVDNNEIDRINILNASISAMHRAIDKLRISPDFIIVDGNKFKSYKQVPHATIVKGDSKFMSIAAASILAKTYRDDLMLELHERFPNYDWKRNKAYPTKRHKEAIKQFGLTAYHRLTFKSI